MHQSCEQLREAPSDLRTPTSKGLHVAIHGYLWQAHSGLLAADTVVATERDLKASRLRPRHRLLRRQAWCWPCGRQRKRLTYSEILGLRGYHLYVKFFG